MLKKLHLGSGEDYKKGWINLDVSDVDIYGKKIKVDIKHNMNKFPYPFKDNEFDEILMKHTLEHLDDPFKVIEEINRIAKPGAIITITVPHFSSYQSYQDPTHKHYFGINTIDYFKGRNEIILKKIILSRNVLLKPLNIIVNKFLVLYERFFYGIFPAWECIWKLKIKK